MSQTILIENYLKTGQPLTAIAALNMFGCFRLAARINDLKNKGVEVKCEVVKHNGKRFSQYRISNAK